MVDELGSLQQAINYAATKAKLKDYSLDSYPRKSSPLEEFFKQTEEDEIAARVISKKVGKENYELFQKITNPKLNNGVQMALPYQITIKYKNISIHIKRNRRFKIFETAILIL